VSVLVIFQTVLRDLHSNLLYYVKAYLSLEIVLLSTVFFRERHCHLQGERSISDNKRINADGAAVEGSIEESTVVVLKVVPDVLVSVDDLISVPLISAVE